MKNHAYINVSHEVNKNTYKYSDRSSRNTSESNINNVIPLIKKREVLTQIN